MVDSEAASVGETVTDLTGTIVVGNSVVIRSYVVSIGDVVDVVGMSVGFVGDTEGECVCEVVGAMEGVVVG